MADMQRILIVGGGIAGLSLAIALHRRGFMAELVERNDVWSTSGAGIFLPANGVRVLRALGVGTVVEQAGAAVRRWRFFDQAGELLFDADLEALWGAVGPCIGIERVSLQRVLLAGAAAVPTRLGVSVTALAQEAGRVSVGFSDGSAATYDLVVGADGIHSTVRRLTLSAVPPGYTGSMVWRSLIATRPHELSDFLLFMGDGSYCGLIPMDAGHTYAFGIAGGPRFDDPLKGRLVRFRDRFAGFGGPVPEYLAALECDEQLHVSPIEWVELARWHTGRVVLIGDAAHAGPPNMAEGGCMAMEDALVLAEILGSAASVEAALDRYVLRRRPRADWVQEQSRAAGQAWVLPPAIRDASLRERGQQMFYDRFKPLVAMP